MRYYLLFLSMLVNFAFTTAAKVPWTVLIYMEAEDLADVAFKHVYDMLSASLLEHKDASVKIMVQIHTWRSTAWRCTVENNTLRLLKEVSLHNSGAQDIEESILWALDTYPAQHTMVIFSGHGFGILEPSWCDKKQQWCSTYTVQVMPDKAKSEELLGIIDVHRCFLPRRFPRGYISVDSLKNALEKVIAKGHYIDIIGMDACMMGTLEVAHTLAPYARYFIASEECEHKEGWHYKALVDQLDKGYEPYALAREIVYAYGAYYRRQKASRFTLAAIDLACIKNSKENLDTIASLCIRCQKHYGESFTSLVTKARAAVPVFCQLPYSDLYSFYETLAVYLDTLYENEDLFKLKEALLEGMQLLERSVIAVTCSPTLQQAHGLSIYFPINSFDDAYLKTHYAQESTWTEFLKN